MPVLSSATMQTQDFDYELPKDRIAQTPAEPRDNARLMVLDRATGQTEHARFRDLLNWLEPGDLLVANDSRVMHARLQGAKIETGGRVEALLLRPAEEAAASDLSSERGGTARTWRCLLRGKVREGSRLRFASDGQGLGRLEAKVLALLEGGERLIEFSAPPLTMMERAGQLPLPPYIHQQPEDPERYQTIYADKLGSAAAPTAGLHFSPDLRARIDAAGIRWAQVTLHVGLGTFKPVEADAVDAHRMHREWIELGESAAASIAETRAHGGRVVAVGTTSVRVLETAARVHLGAEVRPYQGWSELFLKPGDRFHWVDALITNFHLPRSTLLMLVSAFAGREPVLAAYDEAIARDYRFYSFGDAMLIR